MKLYLLLIIFICFGCNISGEGTININNSESSASRPDVVPDDDEVNGGNDGSNSNSSSSSSSSVGEYKRSLTFSNATATTVSDATFRIQIDTQALILAGKMKNDCSDIKVYEGSNQLATWVGEDSCDSTETDIYFKVPSVSPGAVSLDLFYGDLSATSDHSGLDTFPIFFDDFNRADLFSKVDSNGDTYQIVTNSGGAVNGMGNFTMTGDALKLSTNVSSGYNHRFRYFIDKTDSSSVIVGTKTKWTQEGSGSYSGGGIEFTRVGGSMQTYFKYSGGSYGTGSRLQGNTQRWSTNAITPNIDYYYELEVLQDDLNHSCFRQGCTWNQTRSDTRVPDVFADEYFVSNGGSYKSFLYEVDYLFVRKTLEDGDPAITIGVEGPAD